MSTERAADPFLVNSAYRQRVLSYLLNNSGSSVLVVAERFLSRVAEVADDLERLKSIVVCADATADPGDPADEVIAQLAKRFEVFHSTALLEEREPLEYLDPPKLP